MLPTLFISHGSPMLALEPGRYGAAWRQMAAALPHPDAVVVISAHWATATPSLGSAPRPATLHDFGGFPPALYALDYPAPGAPELAATAAALLQAAAIPVHLDAGRGLDHGVWVPLRFMYPDARLPVVPLSVQPGQDADWHLRMGEALRPLRARSVLLVGSGSLTHNLRDCRFDAFACDQALPYVQDFQHWLHEALQRGDRSALAAWAEQAPQARRAHPTPEHLLPLLVAYGAAGPAGTVTRPLAAYSGGALAMDCYVFT